MNQLSLTLTDNEHARLQRLAALSGHGSPEALVSSLLDHTDQAITRPGAWEREWLEHVVSPAALNAFDEQATS